MAHFEIEDGEPNPLMCLAMQAGEMGLSCLLYPTRKYCPVLQCMPYNLCLLEITQHLDFSLNN